MLLEGSLLDIGLGSIDLDRELLEPEGVQEGCPAARCFPLSCFELEADRWLRESVVEVLCLRTRTTGSDLTGPRASLSSSRERRKREEMRLVSTAPQFHRKCTEDIASDVSSIETSILFVGDVSLSHLSGSGRSRRNQGDFYKTESVKS